jgi:hypothetical protein
MTKPAGVKLEYCPDCKQRALFWNQTSQVWECLNKDCRLKYTSQEFSEYWYNKQSDRPIPRQATRKRRPRQITFVAPLWLVNILESKRFWKLLICSAVIWWCWTAIQYSSNSIGLAFGLAAPILLLYAIKIIFRRFLHNYKTLASQHYLSRVLYSIRKSSFLRFVIILATIALLATTIWSMVSLIYGLTQGAPPVYLLNMLVLIIAQIWLLSWLCGILKHSRQLSAKPKFVVVFWPLLAAVVFCAFVGIPPFSDAKDNTIASITDWWENRQEQTTATTPPPEPPTENLPPPSDKPTSTSTAYDVNKDKYPNRVWTNDYTYLVKGNGRPVELYENPNAKNPTWEQLLSFLRRDNTDKMTYALGSFVCADFAEMLHNNAEEAGIRCGFVILYPIFHACNAFETTDRELVFIDCTGLRTYQSGPGNNDTIVNIRLGTDYVPKYIFSSQLGNTTWTIQSMGTVERYQICWEAGTILDYQYDYAIASTQYVPPYVPTLPPAITPPPYPPSSSYIPPDIPTTTPDTTTPICRSCCEDRCSKYQGIWRNGCIDDCLKGKTNWPWE